MNSKNFAAAAALAGFFLASQAGAFTFLKCGDDPVVWDDPFEMVQNTASIPPGSAKEVALDGAIARWRNVRGMQDIISKSSTVVTPLPIIFIGDGQNDVMVTARSNIGGNHGLTVTFRDTCFWGGDMEWVEADVMIASDLDFGKVGENTLHLKSGRETFLHEFGHALGLDHASGFNIMRPSPPLPLVGGTGETVDVLPDDAQGGRFLYPTFFPEINLFASAQRRQGSPNKILLNNEGTVTKCASGGTLTVNSTVGNNGTVDVTQPERWWVSTSDHAHNGSGTQVGQAGSTTFPANKVKTKQVTLTLPALAPGTYFLYHGVGVEDGESRKDDNVVREALVIKVNAC